MLLAAVTCPRAARAARVTLVVVGEDVEHTGLVQRELSEALSDDDEVVSLQDAIGALPTSRSVPAPDKNVVNAIAKNIDALEQAFYVDDQSGVQSALEKIDALLSKHPGQYGEQRAQVGLWKTAIQMSASDTEGARRAVEEALHANASVTVDLNKFAPELAELVNETRKRLGTRQLTIANLPGDAVVALNGAVVEVSESGELELVPGTHRLEVWAPGLRALKRQIDVSQDTELTLALAVDLEARTETVLRESADQGGATLLARGVLAELASKTQSDAVVVVHAVPQDGTQHAVVWRPGEKAGHALDSNYTGQIDSFVADLVTKAKPHLVAAATAPDNPPPTSPPTTAGVAGFHVTGALGVQYLSRFVLPQADSPGVEIASGGPTAEVRIDYKAPLGSGNVRVEGLFEFAYRELSSTELTGTFNPSATPVALYGGIGLMGAVHAGYAMRLASDRLMLAGLVGAAYVLDQVDDYDDTELPIGINPSWRQLRLDVLLEAGARFGAAGVFLRGGYGISTVSDVAIHNEEPALGTGILPATPVYMVGGGATYELAQWVLGARVSWELMAVDYEGAGSSRMAPQPFEAYVEQFKTRVVFYVGRQF